MMDSRQAQMRRAQRARERHRQRMRRRAAGVAALLAVLAAATVAIASSGGGSATAPSTGNPAAAAGATASHRAGNGHRHAGGSTASALPAGTGRPGTETVPILMYHVIAPPPPGAPFPGLYVTPAEFSAQMAALRSAGWRAVTLDQLRANWTRGTRLPAGRPVVLTFDNGYRSQYTQALPVLRRMAWPADENIQLTGLPPSQGGLTSAQVRAMTSAGWELDTQGISHADLIALTPSELHAQVFSSRATLQRRYGVPVNWFCYPSGHYDPTVITAVRAAGYVGSTTVVPGWASSTEDPYRLPRLRVLGQTSPSSLLSQIATARGNGPPAGAYPGA